MEPRSSLKVMARRTYSDEDKAAALLLLADASKTFYEVRDATGIPVGTLHGWATEAGYQRSDDKTEAATIRRRLRLSAKREALAERFLDKADDMMERMDEPHIVMYQKDGEALVIPMGDSSDCKNYATAAAIMLDKFRLEMGESTDRTEHVGVPSKRVEEKLDELAQRREKREAV